MICTEWMPEDIYGTCVRCDRIDCTYNCNGVCGTIEISIGEDMKCEDYKFHVSKKEEE